MRVEKHSYRFDTRDHFPNARVFRGWEGGCAYQAERDGKPFIIIDEGTLAAFLDENDPTDREVMSRLVSVIEFMDEAERQAYKACVTNVGIDIESRE